MVKFFIEDDPEVRQAKLSRPDYQEPAGIWTMVAVACTIGFGIFFGAVGLLALYFKYHGG